MNSSMIIIIVCCFLVVSIVIAAIFSEKFRKDILAQDGSTNRLIFGIFSVSGAAIVALSGLFLITAIFVNFNDNKINIVSLERDLSQSKLNLEKSENQLQVATARLNSQDREIIELKETIVKISESSKSNKLIFKTTGVNDPPYCDSAGSPQPFKVPEHNAAGLPNLAMLVQAVASASSATNDPVGARHRISNLNDGWYNNCRSWIPLQMPAWAQIDLGDDFIVSSVVLGSEHEPFYNDRAATAFSIMISTNQEPNKWQVVFSNKNNPLRNTTPFAFQEVRARYVKIEITDFEKDKGIPRIDEFEIYGRSTD